MTNQFLEKNTIEEMRGISTNEINELQSRIFDGVVLLGYYVKGDLSETNPIKDFTFYYAKNTSELNI